MLPCPSNTTNNIFHSAVTSRLVETKRSIPQLKSWRLEHRFNRLTCHSIDSPVRDVFDKHVTGWCFFFNFHKPLFLLNKWHWHFVDTWTIQNTAAGSVQGGVSRLKFCVLGRFHDFSDCTHADSFLPINTNSTNWIFKECYLMILSLATIIQRR